MKQSCIGVVGLTGQSVFMKVEELPRVGETVKCKEIFREAGGKGHNQAMASAAFGTACVFVSAVGADSFGESSRENLKSGKVDAILIPKASPTAYATILTDSGGDNMVAVYPGAANELTKEDILSAKVKNSLEKCDLLLTQMELQEECLEALLDISVESSIPIILNPAPAKRLAPDLLNQFYLITPNEEEAKVMLGIPPHTRMTPLELGRAVQEAGVQRAVITLGSDGAILVTAKEVRHYAPYKVSPVMDTTGAGDIFNGALASRIALGESLEKAVIFAIVAAGLSVTKKGACSSIPTKEEVEQVIPFYPIGGVYE